MHRGSGANSGKCFELFSDLHFKGNSASLMECASLCLSCRSSAVLKVKPTKVLNADFTNQHHILMMIKPRGHSYEKDAALRKM